MTTGTNHALYPRHMAPRLKEALSDSPAVLLHGPRQCGKTTLAKMVGENLGYAYLNLDDEALLASVQEDPVRFASELPERVILDEVQRAPEFFRVLKQVIDKDRRPGRFLLTGSSNVLLLPRLADSLAGRMEIIRLHPFSQCEIERTEPQFLDSVFSKQLPMSATQKLGKELYRRIVTGGYPPAVQRATGRRRMAWYQSYVDTLVYRDIRELARIRALDVVPRLVQATAERTATLFNLSSLAAPFQVSRPTIGDYVTLLERIFLLYRLPPWHKSGLGKPVKTPKLHMADSGVASALLGMDENALATDRARLGQLCETFVVQEVARQAAVHPLAHRLFHFRDRDGYEVDLVIERASRLLVGVEVKAGATVTERDFRGLRKLQRLAKDRFAAGILLYDGELSLPFGKDLYAVPFDVLWRPKHNDDRIRRSVTEIMSANG